MIFLQFILPFFACKMTFTEKTIEMKMGLRYECELKAIELKQTKKKKSELRAIGKSGIKMKMKMESG